MLTTDLSLRFDPVYVKISRRFYENPDEFAEAFALLETLKINKPLYYQLKREYEGGTYKYDAQYADRLITFLKTL